MKVMPTPVVAIHSFPKWLPQTQTWMYNQLRFLPADRVESHVVCAATENLEQFAVPHLHCFRHAPLSFRLLDAGLRKLGVRRHSAYLSNTCRRLGAELIHSHFGYVGCKDVQATAKLGCQHIVTFYGADVHQVPRQRPEILGDYRKMFDRVAAVLCEGPFLAAQIGQLGCAVEKLIVHPLGVDLQKIPFRPRTWDGREPLSVLIAGTFREKKGIPYALQALGRCAGEVDLRITIIGDATQKPGDAEEKARIISAARSSGLFDVARFLGFQTHDAMLEESLRHHVFLSPSVTAKDGDCEGGAPVSIIEMAASGMLVVGSKHCDIPAVIADGETGYLAEERDVGGLAAKLLVLVSQRRNWGELQRAARSHIETHFDCEKQAARLARIYEHVCGRAGSPESFSDPQCLGTDS